MESLLRPVLEDVALRPARRLRAGPRRRAAAPAAAGRRCRRSTSSPASIVAGLRAEPPRRAAATTSGRRSSSRSLVAFTISLELTVLLSRSIFDPIDALREATERVRRGDLAHARAGRLDRRDRPPRALVQRHGRRPRRSASGCARRSAPTSTRTSPRACCATASRLEGEERRGRRSCSSTSATSPRFAERVERARGRRPPQRVLRARRAAARAPRRPRRTSSSATGCSASSARRTGSPRPRRPRGRAPRSRSPRACSERYGGDLRVGIGVNSGPVDRRARSAAAGDVEFTVIGDAVNTAARVEQVTRQTGDACSSPRRRGGCCDARPRRLRRAPDGRR